MPITISNISYQDIFANSLNFYQANAGDRQTFTCDITENISIIETPAVFLSYFPGLEQISVSGANFLLEGFEVGDEIEVIIYNANGTIHATNTVDILTVSANAMTVDAALNWKS